MQDRQDEEVQNAECGTMNERQIFLFITLHSAFIIVFHPVYLAHLYPAYPVN
jgi:hypothetical protein